MSSELIFYDLTSQKWPSAWSPFTARTALCLNFLEIPYKHNEISYPDIASVLPPLGVIPPPEDKDEEIQYTLPAVTFSDGTIMGSGAIADKLASISSDYDKKLFPQGQKSRDAVKRFEKEVMRPVARSLKLGPRVKAFVPLFLDQRGAEYFVRTREPDMGNLEKLREQVLEEEKERGLQAHVEEAVVPVLEFYDALEKEGDGVFAFGGKEPQYVDFVFVALVQWWMCSRGEQEIMTGLKNAGGGRLASIIEGCVKLLQPRK
ncbi:hypothetical protein E4T47_04932 [Aureobasidium subglaciale]|nr:hypothetical protein E4T47_04932 [Aureobasidium subglaciale]